MHQMTARQELQVVRAFAETLGARAAYELHVFLQAATPALFLSHHASISQQSVYVGQQNTAA